MKWITFMFCIGCVCVFVKLHECHTSYINGIYFSLDEMFHKGHNCCREKKKKNTASASGYNWTTYKNTAQWKSRKLKFKKNATRGKTASGWGREGAVVCNNDCLKVLFICTVKTKSNIRVKTITMRLSLMSKHLLKVGRRNSLLTRRNPQKG